MSSRIRQCVIVQEACRARRRYRVNERRTPLLRRTRPKIAAACIENINYKDAHGLDGRRIAALAGGEWIRGSQHLLITSTTGSWEDLADLRTRASGVLRQGVAPRMTFRWHLALSPSEAATSAKNSLTPMACRRGGKSTVTLPRPRHRSSWSFASNCGQARRRSRPKCRQCPLGSSGERASPYAGNSAAHAPAAPAHPPLKLWFADEHRRSRHLKGRCRCTG